jgi:hypothetical protein
VAQQEPGAPVDPEMAMMVGKIVERVFESIPGAVLTTVTLLDHADARSPSTLASVIFACLATAFVATTVAYNFDTDAELRHSYPKFQGYRPRRLRSSYMPVCSRAAHGSSPFIGRYMGSTPASKMRRFCVLFVVHAAQVLSRTVTLALLCATQPWWAAVYLGGDFLVLVAYKAARRDLVHWVPGFGGPIALPTRCAIKFFTDRPGCVQFAIGTHVAVQYTVFEVQGAFCARYVSTSGATG